MMLDIRQLARGVRAADYDDPAYLDSKHEEEEVDIRKLRRRCRYSHHSRPAIIAVTVVSHGRAHRIF